MTQVDEDKIRAQYAAPYYLGVHLLGDAERRDFVRLARHAELDEVLWMLATREWRPRAAGAWFALVRNEPEVVDALRQSLVSAESTLTAPFLGVALAELLGTESLPALLEYQAHGIREGHGPQGVITALIRELGGTPLLDDATEPSVDRLAAYRTVAHRVAQG